MKGLKFLVFMFAGFMFVLFPFGSAIAAEINLTYGASEGANHTFSKADKAWIEKIEQDTKGRVKITPYWGGTLLSRRENTDELIRGVADLGYISPRTGYPLMLGTYGFPYGISDWKVIWRIYEEVDKKFPELDGEFDKLKIMAKSVASNYQLMSRKPVRSAADFKGLMVKATGAYISVIKELGGDAAYIPMGDTYVALQKGTIDACLAPYNTLYAYKFHEVAKYITVLDLQSAVRPTRAMNLNSWNKLPKDIQEIFNKSIAFWSLKDNESRDADDVAGEKLARDKGVEFIKLPPQDLAAVYKASENAMMSEAAKLDEKGLPGTKIFQEVRRLVEQNIK